MSSWTYWTDDFLKNNVRNLIDILGHKTKQKLTSCLYPVYSLWQACCCRFGWKIRLREPFSGGKISIKGGESGRKIHTVV